MILVEKGMIGDHLPNRVLNTLKLCWNNLLLNSPHYDPPKIKQLREKREKLYRQVFRACNDNQPTRETGFTFLVHETPMTSEQRLLSAGTAARYRAAVQQQTEPPVAAQAPLSQYVAKQSPPLSVVVTAEVHCSEELTEATASSMANDQPKDILKNHGVELVTQPLRLTKPNHLNLTVPTKSSLHVTIHSETLV